MPDPDTQTREAVNRRLERLRRRSAEIDVRLGELRRKSAPQVTEKWSAESAAVRLAATARWAEQAERAAHLAAQRVVAAQQRVAEALEQSADAHEAAAAALETVSGPGNGSHGADRQRAAWHREMADNDRQSAAVARAQAGGTTG